MKAFLTPTILAASVASGLLFSASVAAAPWVDASDIYLRADIQALADAGVIRVPVNTFPLMWSGIGGDLAKVEPELLSPRLVQAFARVNFYYQNAVDNRGNARVKLSGATDPARFQHYGSDYREKGEAKASYEYLGSRVAYKTTVAETYDPQDNKNFRLDESYFAVIMGNWIATLGTVEQWWGPGFDSALHRSNNARPMQSLSLSRNNAAAFETPWLSWIGPWTFKTGFSMAEKERAVPKTAEWDMRFTAKPLQQLEIGLSWSTLFCGEGQNCDFDSWWDSVAGNVRVDVDDSRNHFGQFRNCSAVGAKPEVDGVRHDQLHTFSGVKCLCPLTHDLLVAVTYPNHGEIFQLAGVTHCQHELHELEVGSNVLKLINTESFVATQSRVSG